MAEYEITGVEEVVTTHQIVNVEVEGVPYAFATKDRIETSEVDARSYTLRDIESGINDRLQSQDRNIKHINYKLSADKRIARFGEALMTLNAAVNYVLGEVHNNHDTSFEGSLGAVAIGAIVAGELFIRNQSRKTEGKLAVAQADRGRLASLRRQTRPRREAHRILVNNRRRARRTQS